MLVVCEPNELWIDDTPFGVQPTSTAGNMILPCMRNMRVVPYFWPVCPSPKVTSSKLRLSNQRLVKSSLISDSDVFIDDLYISIIFMLTILFFDNGCFGEGYYQILYRACEAGER